MLPKFCLTACCALLCAVVCTPASAQATGENPARANAKKYPAEIEGATVEVYKSVDDVKLNAYIFAPEGHAATDRRPAIVFFFGGGWKSGSPTQFEEHCKYLASRGMVAVTADYRVASRHGVKAVTCVEDAKSAIRWLRSNAPRLGVDADRVVAAGGSAGGHLAACTGVLQQFDQSGEDLSISSVPNALALFNPALVLAPVESDEFKLDEEKKQELQERMGVELEALSPYQHVRADLPPTIIFHGKADTTVPYRTAELFCEAMQAAGNRCELVGYENQPHGFFNHGRGKENHFKQTVLSLDAFLVSLGYLDAEIPAASLKLLD